MLSRRRFLLLLGGATAGMWLASTGLVTLDRHFVLRLAGECSFCGIRAEALRALVGVTGRPYRVCNECVWLCCDLLKEEGVRVDSPPPPEITAEVRERRAREVAERLEELPARIRSALLRGDHESINNLVKEFFAVDPVAGRLPEFQCSFCDAHRRDVRKLITGPRVFICDNCVVDAAGTVTRILRA